MARISHRRIQQQLQAADRYFSDFGSSDRSFAGGLAHELAVNMGTKSLIAL